MAKFYDYKHKSGSYLKTIYNNHTQTLQVNTSADKFFRNELNLKHEDTVSNTIVYVLLAFGDIHATHRGPDNKTFLNNIDVEINKLPQYKIKILKTYLLKRLLDKGISKRKFNRTNNFLKEYTNIKPFEWSDDYEVKLSMDTSKNELSSIADKYF